jgi:hypothetical protein
MAHRIVYLPPTMPAMDDQVRVPAVNELSQLEDPPNAKPATSQHHSHLTLIALKSETVLAVESYRIEQGRLSFVAADGLPDTLDLDEVDWRITSQLNANPRAWSMAKIQ